MIDLAPQYLKTVTSILAALVPTAEVRAFGSRVTWTAKSYSDLDIAIVGRRKLTLSELSKLSVAFEESDLPVRVDVLDWHAISPEFQEVIRQKYEVIQEGVKAIREKGERYTQYGLIPGGWNEGVLGDFITLQRGFDLPEYERYSGEIPVVTSSGISDFHNEAKVKAPGVVMGRYGTLGKIYYITDDFWPHNTTLYVKDFKGNDPRFFSYFLKTLNYQAYNDKSSVPGLNRNHLHLIPVLIPPLPEQRAIASILGALDDKIELNRRMNATLEEMARAVFQEMVNVAGGEEKAVGDIVTVVGGSTPSTSNPAFWEGGNINWATPKDLASLQSPILLNTNSRITELGLSQISSGLLPAGTVLLSSRAPIGYMAITQIPVAINQGFIGIKCTKEVPNYFILNWLKENMEEIIGRANGTTFLEISKSNFRPMKIIIPPPEKMKVFVEHAEPLYQKIVSNLKESRTLASLRDTLLPKLMRG